MSLLARIVSCLLFAWVLVAPARAQDGIKFFNPERFERATKADDKGILQWADHADVKCPTCSGTGKAKCTTCERFGEDATNCPECHRKEGHECVCRACAGTGKFPDPLQKALCPGCMGAGFLLCMVCGGGGRLKVDKAKRWSDCPACRGTGAYKCGVCNGDRLVEVAALKPSLAEANAATLQKAIAATDQALAAMEGFTPTGGPKIRKDVKALEKMLTDVQANYPAIKREPKVLDDFMGKTYAGSQFQGHEEQEVNAMNLIKGNTVYFLKHQKHMMELALKRQEANAAIEGGDKGK